MGQLIRAKYWDWQASLLGASVIAFGLGVLLSKYFNNKVAWSAIIIGVFLHGWGMYRMYGRKNHG